MAIARDIDMAIAIGIDIDIAIDTKRDSSASETHKL